MSICPPPVIESTSRDGWHGTLQGMLTRLPTSQDAIARCLESPSQAHSALTRAMAHRADDSSPCFRGEACGRARDG